MIEVSRLTLLVLGELLVGLALLSGVLAGMMIVRKGKIRKAAQHLVERIQSDKESRTERLRVRLAEQYLYAGEKLEQGIHDLTQVEMRLYQNTINSYLKQNVVEFQQTDVDVENLVLAYQGLDVPASDVGPSVEDEEISNESEEVQRLTEENTRLLEELRVTMDTIGRMLNEYSSIFPECAENQLEKAQIQGTLEGSESIVEEEAEDTTGDPPLNDEPESNMTETDVDDLVEPLTQIDEEESILDIDESVSGTPDIALDETQEHIQEVDLDADLAPEEPASDQVTAENSLMDDMEQVDIEIPDVAERVEDEMAEPGSLEDEWAKLLEEDAESLVDDTEPGVKDKNGSA